MGTAIWIFATMLGVMVSTVLLLVGLDWYSLLVFPIFYGLAAFAMAKAKDDYNGPRYGGGA